MAQRDGARRRYRRGLWRSGKNTRRATGAGIAGRRNKMGRVRGRGRILFRSSWPTRGLLVVGLMAASGFGVPPLAAVYAQVFQNLDRTIALAIDGSALLVVIIGRVAALELSVQDEADVFELPARRDLLAGLPNRRTSDLMLARMLAGRDGSRGEQRFRGPGRRWDSTDPTAACPSR